MHILRKKLLTGLCALLISSSSGCAELKYYADLVGGHLQILSQKQSIDDVLQDPATDEETKRKLRLVQDARAYAFEKLHLPETEAYTEYVRLQKPREEKFQEQNPKSPKKSSQEKNGQSKEEMQDYVVVFMTACKSDSFEVKEWWYPLVGFQEVRSFYDKNEAETYKKELLAEGWDVVLTESRGYSTGTYLNNSLLDEPLGDPITDVMLNQSDASMIEYLFHEISHQVVFVESDTAFNESFAEFVGEEGTRQYLRDHQLELPQILTEKSKKRKDERLFQDIVTYYTGQLALVYDSSLPREEKLKEKVKLFQEMKETYLQAAQPLGAGRAWWFAQELNNAHLIHLQHYRNHVDAFAALFAHAAKQNWEEFYLIVKHIAGWPEGRRKEYMERIPQPL